MLNHTTLYAIDKKTRKFVAPPLGGSVIWVPFPRGLEGMAVRLRGNYKGGRSLKWGLSLVWGELRKMSKKNHTTRPAAQPTLSSALHSYCTRAVLMSDIITQVVPVNESMDDHSSPKAMSPLSSLNVPLHSQTPTPQKVSPKMCLFKWCSNALWYIPIVNIVLEILSGCPTKANLECLLNVIGIVDALLMTMVAALPLCMGRSDWTEAQMELNTTKYRELFQGQQWRKENWLFLSEAAAQKYVQSPGFIAICTMQAMCALFAALLIVIMCYVALATAEITDVDEQEEQKMHTHVKQSDSPDESTSPSGKQGHRQIFEIFWFWIRLPIFGTILLTVFGCYKFVSVFQDVLIYTFADFLIGDSSSTVKPLYIRIKGEGMDLLNLPLIFTGLVISLFIIHKRIHLQGMQISCCW